MPLDTLNLTAAVEWKMSKDVTGFKDAFQGQESKAFALAPTIATWDQLFAAYYTIAASGTQLIDLSSFTSLVGEAVTGTSALFLVLIPTGVDAECTIEPDATNGLEWFFGAGTLVIPTGGFLMYCEPDAGGVVIDGTHKELLVTNTGSDTLTLYVLIGIND